MSVDSLLENGRKTTNGGSTAVAVRQTDDALANLTDGARFEQLQRVATMMGSAAFTPAHLRGKTQQETIANCFRVVNQAMRWGFDPFAVGDETYVVHGRLGYQGKLVAAVINARAGLDGRLKAEFSGSGDGRTVKITGKFVKEDDPRTIELTVGQARTSNEMWKKDPDQKLWYSGVVKWSRRHCPELILGVLTDDDLERIAQPVEVAKESAASIDAEILGATSAASDEPAKGRKKKAPPTIVEAVPVDVEPVSADGKTPVAEMPETLQPADDFPPPSEEIAQGLIERIKRSKKTTELDAIRGEMMKGRAALGEAYDKVKREWDAVYKALPK